MKVGSLLGGARGCFLSYPISTWEATFTYPQHDCYESVWDKGLFMKIYGSYCRSIDPVGFCLKINFVSRGFRDIFTSGPSFMKKVKTISDPVTPSKHL